MFCYLMFYIDFRIDYIFLLLAFSNFGASLEEGKIGSIWISVFPMPLTLTSFTKIFRLGMMKPNSILYLYLIFIIIDNYY